MGKYEVSLVRTDTDMTTAFLEADTYNQMSAKVILDYLNLSGIGVEVTERNPNTGQTSDKKGV